MTPTSQSVVTHTYGESERGRALGIYAGVSAAGIALGPILGGALTAFVDWRAIFFVNVPVGIATFVLTRYSPSRRSAGREAAVGLARARPARRRSRCRRGRADGDGGLAFPNQSYAWMVPAFVLAGVRVGLIQSPALTDAMNASPSRQQGEAAGILGTTQQVGGTIGIAVMTAVITPLFLRFAVENLDDIGVKTTEAALEERLLAETADGSLPSGVTSQQVDAFKDAFSSALSVAYLIIVVLLLVAFAVTFALIQKLERRPDRGPVVAA